MTTTITDPTWNKATAQLGGAVPLVPCNASADEDSGDMCSHGGCTEFWRSHPDDPWPAGPNASRPVRTVLAAAEDYPTHDPWAPENVQPYQGHTESGWPGDDDLTAGSTEVRLHLLDCGHVTWVAHPVSPPSTINCCLACQKPARVEHYRDELFTDA